MKILFLRLSAIVALTMATYTGSAQSVSHEQLKKLHYLTGIWKGEGWTMVNGIKQSFLETETASVRLSGAAFEIQASGVSSLDPSKKIVNAVALISYDEATSKYLMRLVDGDGSSIDAYLLFTGSHTLEWGLKDAIRFTIEVNDNTWKETGYKNNSGTWVKTFEMALTKQ